MAVERRLAPPPPQPIWIGAEEAARMLGLTVAFVKRAMRLGHIPHVRDGQGYKVKRADLADLELSAISAKLHETAAELKAAVERRRATA